MYQSIAICFNPFVLGLENVEHIHICTCIQNIELITHPISISNTYRRRHSWKKVYSNDNYWEKKGRKNNQIFFIPFMMAYESYIRVALLYGSWLSNHLTLDMFWQSADKLLERRKTKSHVWHLNQLPLDESVALYQQC